MRISECGMSDSVLARRRPYIAIGTASFLSGISILLFAPASQFLRGFMSDVVVVIFIYAAIRSLFMPAPLKLALGGVSFAFLLEVLQYAGVADSLALTGVARTALGATFDWLDLLAYALGLAVMLLAERSLPGRAYVRVE